MQINKTLQNSDPIVEAFAFKTSEADDDHKSVHHGLLLYTLAAGDTSNDKSPRLLRPRISNTCVLSFYRRVYRY